MGAQIATAAARQAPELAVGLVLIGPVVDRRRRSVWRQAAALGHDSLRELPSANLIVLTDYLRTGIRWYLREVRPMMDYRLEEEIGQVACPVLVLRGSRDPVAREPWCRELSEAARAGTFKDIPGQPHVAQHGAPHLTAEAILDFTAGLRSGLAGPGRDAARDPELPRN
jgi:pimeloyl-ACP methyl ester carboxylesterase